MTKSVPYLGVQPPQKAVIYCRVSSVRQRIEGSGLESQEHRCRSYAESRGYEVAAVFPDDISGGGDFMKRPGMVALLSFIDAQPSENFVVIFDDLKRFARDTVFHIKLRQEFKARGAIVECLNFRFEDTPEGRFSETIVAAQGELEREQNRRQTVQKMKARVEKGYWVFCPPTGLQYDKVVGHGKLLTRKEPLASIIEEALEGFASGRFETQVEVKRFLERQPAFPKDFTNGEIRAQRVTDLLTNPLYAGCVERPNWDISLRKGQHEGLISLETFERIQERRAGKAKAPARKDLNADFPLRGFVRCGDCGKPMTACWSKGRSKRHPYYLCDTRGCVSYRKSVRRDAIEGDFEDILQTLQPTKGLIKVARAMFHDAWEFMYKATENKQAMARRELDGFDRKIEQLVERLVASESNSVSKVLEREIDKLERKKLVLADKAVMTQPPRNSPAEFIEPAMAFLSNPWNIWKNGNLAVRRTVLRLVFSEPLEYVRKEGYRTAKTTFPFKVLADLSRPNCEMVRSRCANLLFFHVFPCLCATESTFKT